MIQVQKKHVKHDSASCHLTIKLFTSRWILCRNVFENNVCIILRSSELLLGPRTNRRNSQYFPKKLYINQQGLPCLFPKVPTNQLESINREQCQFSSKLLHFQVSDVQGTISSWNQLQLAQAWTCAAVYTAPGLQLRYSCLMKRLCRLRTLLISAYNRRSSIKQKRFPGMSTLPNHASLVKQWICFDELQAAWDTKQLWYSARSPMNHNFRSQGRCVEPKANHLTVQVPNIKTIYCHVIYNPSMQTQYYAGSRFQTSQNA